MLTDNIGWKIKKIRELRNISQSYMAEKLSISQKAYSKIENCEIKLTEDRLNLISKILDVDKDDIINFNERNIFNSYNNSGDGIVFKKIIVGDIENEHINQLLKNKDDIIASLNSILSKYEQIIKNNKA